MEITITPQIESLILWTLDQPKYSDERKAGWRDLFTLAKREAKHINRNSSKNIFTREIDETQILDHWLAYAKLYLDHCNPSDDICCGDMSCVQALKQQQDEYIIDLRNSLHMTTRQIKALQFSKKAKQKERKLEVLHAREKAIRKQLEDELKTTVTRVEFHSYEEWSSRTDSDFDYDDPEFMEDHAHALDSTLTIHQEQPEDPNNFWMKDNDSKHLAISRTLGSRHNPNNPKFKYRGNRGPLGGIYSTTNPEKPYSSWQNKHRILKLLRRSDNECDIRLFFAMTAPRPTEHSTPESHSKKIAQWKMAREGAVKKLLKTRASA